MTDVPTERVMEAEYLADHALMVELQVMPYVSGVALPTSLIALIAGISLGGFWIIPFCLIALVLLAFAYYTATRGLEARSLAGAHAMAAALTRALQSHSTGDE